MSGIQSYFPENARPLRFSDGSRARTIRNEASAATGAGQVNTDYDPEGLSLPAQRQACTRRAAELGAIVADEYVEPGRTATTTDNRPRFMEMMARIKAEKDVDYVVVYARSRLHRNVEDAAITRSTLRKLGVQLISVMDYTEDSYIGDLVATVLDGVNEYQSKQSGADIRYKMGQKAKTGGTVTRAPLGYLNIREEVDGRTVATVKVDPDRAPYIAMAFELYATGKHTLKSLHAHVSEAGLRTRPTPKWPSKPISLSRLGYILRDRYYTGKIEYQDEEYPGRHQPLISEELFERVQRIIDIERHGGKRDRIHDHYLKALLWCDRCQHRLILTRGKSHSGDHYFYYLCRGRQDHICDLPYLSVEQVEDEVVRHYRSVQLTEKFRTFLGSKIDETMNDANAVRTQVRSQLTKRLKELVALEDHYFDLVGNPAWPQAKLEARMKTVAEEKIKVEEQLGLAGVQLSTGRQTIAALFDLLTDPHELYRQASRRVRRVLNKAIFTKLYLDADEDHRPLVARDELTETVAPVVSAQRGPGVLVGYRKESGVLLTEHTVYREPTLTELLELAWGQGCWSKAVMVELRGFEPLTPSMRTRCATRLRHNPNRSGPKRYPTGDKGNRSARRSANQAAHRADVSEARGVTVVPAGFVRPGPAPGRAGSGRSRRSAATTAAPRAARPPGPPPRGAARPAGRRGAGRAAARISACTAAISALRRAWHAAHRARRPGPRCAGVPGTRRASAQ